jgi:hypothetical protein
MSKVWLAVLLLHFRRHQPAEALLKEALMTQIEAGFDLQHPHVVSTKDHLQIAKSKAAIRNAVKLPKPHTRCPCGSDKKHRDCCY